MQDKLGKLKNKGKDDDEEIKSNDSDGGYMDNNKTGLNSKRNQLLDDPFLQAAAEEEHETAEEKRLKMAKGIIQEYAREEKNDFFDQLHAKTQHEEEIMEAGDDLITKRMKMHLLEKKGKLFYQIASDFTGFSDFEKEEGKDKTKAGAAAGEVVEEEEVKKSSEQVISDDLFDRTFMKGHKGAITCMDWATDNKSLITGSKDCSLIKWDLETQQKLFFRGRKFDKAFDGHNDEVLCAKISPNGKYLVSGGKDRIVRVWDIHNQTQVHQFLGHRDSITGITFDEENDQFYTVSKDRSLKVWNIREMTYMDTHYGHHSDIHMVDSFSRDRVITCGMDN